MTNCWNTYAMGGRKYRLTKNMVIKNNYIMLKKN